MKTLKITRRGDITPITYIDPGQIAEIEKHGNKFHEFTMLEAIAAMPIPKGTFIDIGAHVGNHSIFFAKYCKQCEQVQSYEASRITFDALCKNVGRYPNIFAANMALGAWSGTCHVEHNADRPGQSTITQGDDTIMTTIDNIPFIFPPVLIKIDVEGNEYDVLMGGRKTIEQYRPELFVETWHDPNELLTRLPKGYRIVKRYNNAPTYHLTSK